MGIQNQRTRGLQHCQHLFLASKHLGFAKPYKSHYVKLAYALLGDIEDLHILFVIVHVQHIAKFVKVSSILVPAPYITQGFCSLSQHPENRDCADSSFLSLLRRALSVVVRPLLNLLYSSTFCNSRSLSLQYDRVSLRILRTKIVLMPLLFFPLLRNSQSCLKVCKNPFLCP